MANAWTAADRMGRRVDSAAARQGSYRVSQPGCRTAPRKRGKREKTSARREQWHIAQLVCSAILLLIVIGVKLAAPDVLDRYRDELLHLMGQDTDFVAAFSAVGEAIGNGALSDMLDEAYQEVFGSTETENIEETAQSVEKTPEISGEIGQADETGKDEAEKASASEKKTVYTPENLPKDVCLTQQVLGFAYADPVAGSLSSAFGYREHPVEGEEKFHYGLDIAADEGTVIAAFAAGLVTAVGESATLGKYVMLAHDGGYTTLYAHCSRVTASSGQTVKLGDPIAEVGQTGEATGAHLHFEVHQNTTYLNPIYYVTY